MSSLCKPPKNKITNMIFWANTVFFGTSLNADIVKQDTINWNVTSVSTLQELQRSKILTNNRKTNEQKISHVFNIFM